MTIFDFIMAKSGICILIAMPILWCWNAIQKHKTHETAWNVAINDKKITKTKSKDIKQ